MSEKESVESLKKLGLTEYEAKAYAALARIKTGIVSDIHMISGVPRSALYGVLSKLQEKGIIEVQHTKPMKYKAVSPKRCLEKLKADFIRKSGDALESLEELYRTEKVEAREEAVWTINGIENIGDRVMEMVEKARGNITFVASYSFFADVSRAYNILKNLAPTLNEKLAKGVRVRIIGSNKKEVMRMANDVPGADGRYYPNTGLSTTPMRGGILIIDDSEVLITIFSDISLHGMKGTSAIWSNGKGVVSIFKHFIEAEWDASVAYRS
jgi:sugar-specific transcriptional regulator TrmB